MGISKLKQVLLEGNLLKKTDKAQNANLVFVDFSTIFYRYVHGFGSEAEILQNVFTFFKKYKTKHVYIFYDEGNIELKKSLRAQRQEVIADRTEILEQNIKLYQKTHNTLDAVNTTWEKFLAGETLSTDETRLLMHNAKSCIKQIQTNLNDISDEDVNALYNDVKISENVLEHIDVLSAKQHCNFSEIFNLPKELRTEIDETVNSDDEFTLPGDPNAAKKIRIPSREESTVTTAVLQKHKNITLDENQEEVNTSKFYGGVLDTPEFISIDERDVLDNFGMYSKMISYYFNNSIQTIGREFNGLKFKQKIQNPKVMKELAATIKERLKEEFPDFTYFDSNSIDAEFFLGQFMIQNASILKDRKLIVSTDQDILLFCANMNYDETFYMLMNRDVFLLRPNSMIGFIGRLVLLFNGGDYNDGVREKKLSKFSAIPDTLIQLLQDETDFIPIELKHLTTFIKHNELQRVIETIHQHELDDNSLHQIQYSLDFVNRYGQCDEDSYDMKHIIDIKLTWTAILYTLVLYNFPKNSIPQYKTDESVNIVLLLKIIVSIFGLAVDFRGKASTYTYYGDRESLIRLKKYLQKVKLTLKPVRGVNNIINDSGSLYISDKLDLYSKFGNLLFKYNIETISGLLVSESKLTRLYRIEHVVSDL